MKETFIKLEDINGEIININIQELVGEKIAIHCDTEEKANEFLNKLDSEGVRWDDGEKITEANEYIPYQSNICYDLEDGIEELGYSDKNWYKFLNFKIYKYVLDKSANKILKVWELEEGKEYREITEHNEDTKFRLYDGELECSCMETEWKIETKITRLETIFSYEFIEIKTKLEKEVDKLLENYNKEDIIKILNKI